MKLRNKHKKHRPEGSCAALSSSSVGRRRAAFAERREAFASPAGSGGYLEMPSFEVVPVASEVHSNFVSSFFRFSGARHAQCLLIFEKEPGLSKNLQMILRGCVEHIRSLFSFSHLFSYFSSFSYSRLLVFSSFRRFVLSRIFLNDFLTSSVFHFQYLQSLFSFFIAKPLGRRWRGVIWGLKLFRRPIFIQSWFHHDQCPDPSFTAQIYTNERRCAGFASCTAIAQLHPYCSNGGYSWFTRYNDNAS